MTLPTVVFITALPCEFEAVAEYFDERKEQCHPKGTVYEVGKYLGKHETWQVAVVEIGKTNPSAAQETERAS
ncbi:MAG: hypothetical protein R3E08_01535 [Thiotrichaceae bacterium]